METHITDLPPELVLTVVDYLPGSDIVHLSQTCTQFRKLCHIDSLWKKQCLRAFGSRQLEEYELSFYDIYIKGYHRFERCIGIYRRNWAVYGGLVQVKAENGKIVVIEYEPPDNILGNLKWRYVFSIRISKVTNETEILGLNHRIGSIKLNQQIDDITFEHVEQGKLDYAYQWTDDNTILRINRHLFELTPIKIQPPNPCYPIQPGFFIALYGTEGIQIVLLKYDMENRKADVIKITGDANCEAGDISIFVDLRKQLNMTREQQTDLDFMKSLNAEYITDVEDIHPMEQPLVLPPRNWTSQISTTSCQFRFFSRGILSSPSKRNPGKSSAGHFVVVSESCFINVWLEARDEDMYMPFFRVQLK